MKDLLFLVADLWMVYAGFRYGRRFIREHHNYLLGLEFIIVATSGCNFLLWSLLGGKEGSPLYDVAYFFDAFSRSVGITLILVLGLMKVTHRYRPSLAVEVGAFGLAIAAGLYLQQFRAPTLYVGPATFYVVVNVLTTLFLLYFSRRVWQAGARSAAVWAGTWSLLACAIAADYDFVGIPGDDAHHTIFYILALTVWGFQIVSYYHAYTALRADNIAQGLEPATSSAVAASV